MYRIIFFACLLIPRLVAGQAGFSPCKNVAQFKQQYTEASKGLSTIRSKFTQEKSISMLKNKLVSYGEFSFKRNDMLRMEFTQPYKYLFILNGGKVYILDNQKKTEVSTSGNKLFKKISQITISSVSGDILNSKDFSNQVLENDNQYLLILKPLSKEIKDFFTQFQIYISKKDHLVDRIDMTEASGDYTTLTFTDKQVNIPLNNALFTLN